MATLTPVTRKELYLDAIANGGEVSLTPVTREEVYLEAILEHGTMPSVTAEDNGKVLKVVSGAWEAGSVDGSVVGVEIERVENEDYGLIFEGEVQ